MKAGNKEKVRKLKLKIWKMIDKNDRRNSSVNPTCYEKSTAVSEMNKDSDGPSKDSKEVNLVPRNQPENSKKQRSEEKELRASLTVRRTGQKA